MAKSVLNLEDFFSTSNEQNGVWHEPVIDGFHCGFEFLLTGFHSDENAMQAEAYDKERTKLDAMEESPEKSDKIKRLEAHRFADFVKDIRGVNGAELKLNGEKVVYSKELIEKLLYESLPLQEDIYKFCVKSTNFMQGKKNKN